MLFLNLYTKISIELWIRNTLLQKFLQTDMISRSIQSAYDKIRKYFAEFMIPIALLKEFAS